MLTVRTRSSSSFLSSTSLPFTTHNQHKHKHRLGDDEPSEPSCLTYTDEDSCLEHACGWCTSEVLGGRLEVEGCLAESVAKLVPTVGVGVSNVFVCRA